MSVFFKDIIGQKAVIEQLRRSVDSNRLAHALLITGPRGNGKLAIAVALANYLLCGKGNGDACGVCPAKITFSGGILRIATPHFFQNGLPVRNLVNDGIVMPHNAVLNTTPARI